MIVRITARHSVEKACLFVMCVCVMVGLKLDGKRRRIKGIGGDAEVDKDFLSVDKLLCNDSGNGKHGHTPVLELLRRHGGKVIVVVGLEAERIKANISGVVAFSEDLALVVSRIFPSLQGASEFGGTNDNGQDLEEERSGGTDLVQMANGGTNVARGGLEERVELQGLFGDDESQKGEHGNTAVGGFGLAVGLHLGETGTVGESEGVEFLDWIEGSGKSVGELGVIGHPSVEVAGSGGNIQRGRCGRSLGGHKGRSSGECEKGGENEFHCVVVWWL